MDPETLIFLSSGLLLGWSLGANDAANVFGTAVSTRMIKFSTAAIICSIFIILGAVFSGAGAAHTLGKLGAINALGGSFVAAFSAAVTVYWMTRLTIPVSTSQAIVGAIVGWNIYSGTLTDMSSLLKIVMTWIACPILACIISMILYKAARSYFSRKKIHILKLDSYTRIALVLAGAVGSYSLGANNIANVMGVFIPSNPFTTINTEHFTITPIQQLFLIGAIAISVGVFTYSKRVMMTVGEGIMPLSPVAAWVVVISHSIVLFLFASERLEAFLAAHGLPTLPLVPVSSSQAVVGAVIGIGLVRKGREIKWSILGRIGSGWAITPVIAAFICLVSLFIVQNVFNREVYKPLQFEITEEVINQAKSNNIPTWEIREIKGQTFNKAYKLEDELQANTSLSDDNIEKLIKLSEVKEVYIDKTKFPMLDDMILSDEQKEAVKKLAGRKYKYPWQLKDDLEKITDDWKPLPENQANKPANKLLRQEFNLICRKFEI